MSNLNRETVKNYWALYVIKKNLFFSFVCMRDVGSGMGVKNISDLVLKEIYGICKTKNPTKEQVMNIKWQKEKFIKSLLI